MKILGSTSELRLTTCRAVTPKQHDTLEMILCLAACQGRPPSTRELAKAQGKSFQAVHFMLDKLKNMGLLTSQPRQSNTIRLTNTPEWRVVNNSPNPDTI